MIIFDYIAIALGGAFLLLIILGMFASLIFMFKLAYFSIRTLYKKIMGTYTPDDNVCIGFHPYDRERNH